MVAKNWCLVGVAVLALGCSRQSTPDKLARAGSLEPGSPAAAEAFAATDRDCLQYPTGTATDGSEIWNADWVFFSLVRTSDSTLALGPDGKPLAVNLLHSQVVQFIGSHERIDGTGWTWSVKRTERHVRDGKVISQSDYATLDDVDLAELIQKDRAARSR